MSLFPKYIIFNNFLKMSLCPNYHTTKNPFTFNSNDIKNEIYNLELLGNKESKESKEHGDIKEFRQRFNKINSIIDFTCKDINNNNLKIIKKDICNYSYFNNNSRWYITNLIRKYNLSSFDVFYSLLQKKFTISEKRSLYQ